MSRQEYMNKLIEALSVFDENDCLDIADLTTNKTIATYNGKDSIPKEFNKLAVIKISHSTTAIIIWV